MNRLRLAVLLLAGWLGMAGNAQALELAGNVQAHRGEVRAQTVGWEVRLLNKGDTFYSGDRIFTGKNASVYLQFLDDTFFVLGPQSEMVIDKFKPLDAVDEGITTRVLKGTFRFISGLLAKKNPSSMRVGALVATIGIRGTQVAGEVFERRIENGVEIEASAQITLLEPEQDGAQTAIEVSNAFGSVVVDQPGFGTEIPDEHSPPSPVRRMQIRSINNILRVLRGATRPRAPRPTIR